MTYPKGYSWSDLLLYLITDLQTWSFDNRYFLENIQAFLGTDES